MKGPRRGKHKYVQRELHVYNDAAFLREFVRGWATRLFKQRSHKMKESPGVYSRRSILGIHHPFPQTRPMTDNSSAPPFSDLSELKQTWGSDLIASSSQEARSSNEYPA